LNIADRVYLVGSGKYGMELSDSMDCNVYLLDGGDGLALIDAGGGVDPERIVDNVRRSGFDPARITHLLLTHAHADHAAGARYFYDAYGAETIASVEAAKWLTEGDMEKTSFAHAMRGGVYPRDFRFPACPIRRAVREGDAIVVGDIALRAIDSPGHSRGHLCFLWEEADGRRSLFAGDSIFAGGKVVVQNVWDCEIGAYANTARKLHELSVDRLFAGHGPFLLSNAAAHIAKAHERFERLDIPPNL